MATVLVVAGTAGASAAGLITTSQTKNGAVTSAKVKDGSLTLQDFKASERAKLVGPAGADGVADTTIVQSPTVVVPADDTGTVMAFCPAGMRVTSGGYFSSIAVAASSQPDNDGDSWGAIVKNFGNLIPVESTPTVFASESLLARSGAGRGGTGSGCPSVTGVGPRVPGSCA
ncbi:hypothetical protein G6553_04985 [Nocardioides sp. IC4_145]|uniref:hypothetical protein n=1 Tax=Nocardioides sp. IC4_145 TaxID=2714037 RepID=UPI00140B42EF|nr:hypothetical protein [Nocardioides sp. IC4_145]NHC22528.1 hypothetical protein [Nocardioides sp. IC4_145]